MTPLLIAFGLVAACYGSFRYAMSIPMAAGAGAPGSILLAISGVLGLSGVFMFGFAAGKFL